MMVTFSRHDEAAAMDAAHEDACGEEQERRDHPSEHVRVREEPLCSFHASAEHLEHRERAGNGETGSKTERQRRGVVHEPRSGVIRGDGESDDRPGYEQRRGPWRR
jgi:hypothetical protein